jgi:hypothetical protein
MSENIDAENFLNFPICDNFEDYFRCCPLKSASILSAKDNFENFIGRSFFFFFFLIKLYLILLVVVWKGIVKNSTTFKKYFNGLLILLIIFILL